MELNQRLHNYIMLRLIKVKKIFVIFFSKKIISPLLFLQNMQQNFMCFILCSYISTSYKFRLLTFLFLLKLYQEKNTVIKKLRSLQEKIMEYNTQLCTRFVVVKNEIRKETVLLVLLI